MSSNTLRDPGLLILRLGFGGIFILYGYPKITAGPEMWTQLGGATGVFGIHFAPVVFGFLAALSEFGGGICLILGLFMRPACFFMMITMIVATTMHLKMGDDFIKVAAHPAQLAVLFLSLIFIGAGAFSLDAIIFRKK